MTRPRGEFARIDRFVRHFPKARVPVGVGDDCAVLSVTPRHQLCVTTDAIVEDVHFTRRHFTPEDIGHKALAVNVSDLAAMGANPAWFLCAIEVPPWVTDEVMDGLARGMRDLAKRVGIPLVGGNLSSAQKLSLTLTCAGEVPAGRALLRSGARPGDLLYVSGTLGDARWQLSRMEAEGRAGPRQARPEPRVKLGLIARPFASAAIDLSDGLAQDLGHIVQDSRVGARVELAALPLSDELRRAAGDDAPMWALAGGEDYELLLAVPARNSKRFEQACRRNRQRVTRIGEVVRGRKLEVRDAAGHLVRPPSGFDHFDGTESSAILPRP